MASVEVRAVSKTLGSLEVIRGIDVDVPHQSCVVLVVAQTGGAPIQASFHERHDFSPGRRIFLRPRTEAIHLFDAENGRRLN